ncbi:2',5'-phosphodiesterase 12 [Trichomycterus rosablanca]|uniref:2',5'-phosphodiesterase 12 n=1 Tax=Trichomycterus rosablanca TaxID=2290929 RepID=UPI002F357A91
MERAVVRCVLGESKLTISFSLAGSYRHMLREQSEQLGKVLARIANSTIKAQSKAKKSKKNKSENTNSDVAEPQVKLYFNGDTVAEDTVNREAWRDGSVLQVGDIEYKVEVNPPTFLTAQLPVSLLSGFPVCPRLKVEFGDLKHSQFQWYKERAHDAHTGDEGCWAEAGTERVFIPSNADVGLKLKLKCTPGNESRFGLAAELVSASTVEAGPGVCTFDNRHVYTQKGTDESTTRVVTYNILADIYAQTEKSKTVLYPYCAPYALELDYRQNLIKKELSGYNADIVCLQEVDKGVFSDSLSPALDAFDMDGVFRIKERQHEGLATFYRRSKFKLLSQHDIMLSEALQTDALHSQLLEKLSTNPELKEKVVQRSTILQVTILQSVIDPSRIICVGNTHLYWHPKGANVRLIQMAVALKHLKKVITQQHAGTLIFCGDFNSTPSSALYQLLSQGSVPKEHSDWASNGPEELLPMELDCPLQLTSACGEPTYTNYIGGFQGCLDYIFVEVQTSQVEQVIPLPSHEEVVTYHALPSVSHPSDHIALVCDLKWK